MHYRGHGCSGRSVSPDSYRIPVLAEDLELVLNHESCKEVVLIGHSMGVQVALETAATMNSVKVAGLVLMCGSFGRPLDTFRDSAVASQLLPAIRGLISRYGRRFTPIVQRLTSSRVGWWVAANTELDGSPLTRPDFDPYLQHLAAMDPDVFLEMLQGAANHTAEHHLAHIEIPALVVGAERDRFTPCWVSEVMATRLPMAEFLCIYDGTHAAPIEQPEYFERMMTSFFSRNNLWSFGNDAKQGGAASNYG
jgi:pimeloyl-ACP methyl ester carboxylesterase